MGKAVKEQWARDVSPANRLESHAIRELDRAQRETGYMARMVREGATITIEINREGAWTPYRTVS